MKNKSGSRLSLATKFGSEAKRRIAEGSHGIAKCVLVAAPGTGWGNQNSSALEPKQFNFARHWESMIVPHLKDRRVVKALTFGMRLNAINYSEGDPPWLYGRGPQNGQRATKGCFSWYQPWGIAMTSLHFAG